MTSSPKHSSFYYHHKKIAHQPDQHFHYSNYSQAQNCQKSASRVSKVWKVDNENDVTAHSIHPSVISQKMENSLGRREQISQFKPRQDMGVLLANFQDVFEVLLNRCMGKYGELVRQCIGKYEQVRQVLMHYAEHNHSKSYFHQMHIKSTDTKIQLLKMLKDQQKGLKSLQEQNQDLKLEVKKLKKLSISKDQAYLEQASKVKELQAKIEGLSDKLADYQENEKKFTQALKERGKIQMELRNQLSDKNKKIAQIQAEKENMKNDLNQIEEKVRSIKSISPSQSQLKKKSSRKICLKIPSKNEIVYDRIDQDKGVGDEFYRFLLIQACTIQEQFDIE